LVKKYNVKQSGAPESRRHVGVRSGNGWDLKNRGRANRAKSNDIGKKVRGRNTKHLSPTTREGLP